MTEGVRISAATPADVGAVLRVEREAFGADEVPDLVAALLADPTARPSLSLLAWQDDVAVGHVLLTAATLVGASQVSVAILAPLAVMPAWQRRGVGGRLIEEGTARLARAGVGLVFVLGHPSYYPRHGFSPALPFGLDAPYEIAIPDAWMVRALRPRLLGEVRGTVRCAEALDRPEHWRE